MSAEKMRHRAVESNQLNRDLAQVAMTPDMQTQPDTSQWGQRIFKPAHDTDYHGDPTVVLSVVDGEVLGANGEPIDFGVDGFDAKFILNALVQLRPQDWITSEEIEDLGFEAQSSEVARRNKFSRGMRSLTEELAAEFGDTVIQRTGVTRGRNYRLHPGVKLDFKDDESSVVPTNVYLESALTFNARAITRNEARYDSKRVDRIVTEMIKQYDGRPEVEDAKLRRRNNKPVTALLTDSFEVYAQEAAQYNVLTKIQEQKLFRLLRAGIDTYETISRERRMQPTAEEEKTMIQSVAAHKAIYVSNLRLVIKFVDRYFKFAGGGMGKGDMVSHGNIGLAKAITRFDFKRGFKFSTFGVGWINQQIGRAFAEERRTIDIPVHVHEKYAKVKSTESKLAERLQRQPTLAEVADSVGMTVERVEYLLVIGEFDLKSLNAPASSEGPTEVGELLYDPNYREHEDRIDEQITSKGLLAQLLDTAELSHKELVVLGLRSGVKHPAIDAALAEHADALSQLEHVGAVEDVALSGVGKVLGLSREYVRRIEHGALEKLRIAGQSYKDSAGFTLEA